MKAPVRPEKTAVLVAKRIVADIQQRGNKVGDRLPPERVMLEDYNIGRGTLRESLRFLELQGIIVLKPGPGGGPIVQQPDGSGLATALTLLLQFENAPYRTIIEARTALEPMIARLAATRMSDEDLEDLKYTVEEMQAQLSDEAVFLEMNQRFHDIIANNSGNALFGHLINTLLEIIDGTSIGVDYPEHRRKHVYEAHKGIYDALASRDSDSAAGAMYDHIKEYANYVERKFPEVLDKPISWTQ